MAKECTASGILGESLNRWPSPGGTYSCSLRICGETRPHPAFPMRCEIVYGLADKSSGVPGLNIGDVWPSEWRSRSCKVCDVQGLSVITIGTEWKANLGPCCPTDNEAEKGCPVLPECELHWAWISGASPNAQSLCDYCNSVGSLFRTSRICSSQNTVIAWSHQECVLVPSSA